MWCTLSARLSFSNSCQRMMEAARKSLMYVVIVSLLSPDGVLLTLEVDWHRVVGQWCSRMDSESEVRCPWRD